MDPYHDGAIPDEGSPERHQDGLAYRIGAIRETFEETGILLARKNNELVNLDVKDRDAARKMIHGNQVKFLEWLESVGAEPDLGEMNNQYTEENVIDNPRWPHSVHTLGHTGNQQQALHDTDVSLYAPTVT